MRETPDTSLRQAESLARTMMVWTMVALESMTLHATLNKGSQQRSLQQPKQHMEEKDIKKNRTPQKQKREEPAVTGPCYHV